MAIHISYEKEPGPGTLGRTELYALAIGQVIGAGVITLIVPAIRMTGYSAWLAYFAAIIMGFLMILPTVFISSAVRFGGGHYSMLCGLGGPRIAGIYAFAYLTQCISLSLFGVSAAAYLGDTFGGFLATPTGRIIVSAALLGFFYVVNMMGIDIMASAQKLMTWLLIAALLLFAIMGAAKRTLPIFNFSDPNFLVNGWGIKFTNHQISGGFFGAVLLFIYSTQGYSMTISYGRDSKDSRKDIPWVLLAAPLSLIFLYVGPAIAASGVMSLEEYGSSTTLVFAARRIFPTILFYFFIIGGPIMALLSTLNSSFAYNAITIGASCDDGWLPKKFGEKNSRGARKYVLTFMFIIGLIPAVTGMSITGITNMVQLVGACFAFLNFASYIQLPKRYPNAWKHSKYHVPDGVYYMFCCISMCGFMITLWKSCLSLSPAVAIGNVCAIIILAVLGIMRAKTGDIKIRLNLWGYDDEETHRVAVAHAGAQGTVEVVE